MEVDRAVQITGLDRDETQTHGNQRDNNAAGNPLATVPGSFM